MSVRTTARRLTRRLTRQATPPQVRYLFRARVRLTVWHVAVLTVLVVAVGISVYVALARVLKAEVDSDLKSAAVAFRDRNTVFDAGASPRLPGSGQSPYDGAFPDVFVMLLDQQGLLVVNPRGVEVNGLPDAGGVNAAASGHADLRSVTKSGESYRLLSEPIVRDGQIVGFLQIGKSLRSYQHDVKDIALVLAGGGLGAVVLAAAGGLLLTGRALRPVQESWQRQQAFVADASHELRTPLAIVRADAEVMLRAPQRSVEENRELVEDIVGETDRLSALVADMLLLARLDTGRIALHKIEFDARVLLDEVADQTRRLVEDRGIEVSVGGKPSLPVCADVERLRQVLRILVDNAQRHMPSGGRLQLFGRSDGSRVRIEVVDEGTGIAPEDLPHVFERFYRADRARTRSEGGAGLGLAIARGIIDAHGGRLKLQSQPGEGTTATLELPVARA